MEGVICGAMSCLSDAVDDWEVPQSHGAEEVEHLRRHQVGRHYVRTTLHVRRHVLHKQKVLKTNKTDI